MIAQSVVGRRGFSAARVPDTGADDARYDTEGRVRSPESPECKRRGFHFLVTPESIVTDVVDLGS